MTEPREMTEVDGGALHQLDAWLENHEKTIAALEERLGPVLRDAQPVKDAEETIPVSQLRVFANRVRWQDERLRDILERVDL